MQFQFIAPNRGPDIDAWIHDPERACYYGRITLENARLITQGGILAARQYAEAWFDEYQPEFWQLANAAKRGALVADMAKDAMANAAKVVKRGKAHWTQKTKSGETAFCVAHLMSDGSAGAVGYLFLSTDPAFTRHGMA